MIHAPRSLDADFAARSRPELAEGVRLAEEERNEVLRRFPRDRWAAMTLEEYAIGHDRSESSFCRWMEFNTLNLGSMRGGNARKLIIYKRRDDPGWYFPKMFDDEQTAWEHLRRDFIRAFELADTGAWDEIDELETLSLGPALKLKTLHLYFPEGILPVYSSQHLRRYLRLLGRTDLPQAGSAVGLNRALLAVLGERPELEDWSGQERMRLLYRWSDPRGASRVYKIAPGENGKFWEECLAGGYICKGGDGIGDLREFESKDNFKERFAELVGARYGHRKSKITQKANELWTLMELQPGDLVVANQGLSRILGVGEVMEPAYVYRDDRATFRHTVTVRWDTSYAKTIPPQRSWQFVTVAKVPDGILEAILTRGPDQAAQTITPTLPVDPLYLRIENALERKGQLILYGPPGTGKTYTARRFAVWWLLRRAGDADADTILGDRARLTRAEERLSAARSSLGTDEEGASPLTRVTFHPSYTYEDFIEGFRPVDGGEGTLSLRLEDGIFKRVCATAQANPEQTYLILVDEINRGHVAKILGELLTLLERDKRGLTVMLPQSKQLFAIPTNVYVLGTMNTSDRSIKLLDAALRRRFAFLELMPDIDLLRGAKVGDLALDELLDGLNRRIAKEEGREKQIGHSYLLDEGQAIADPAEFAIRFREEILPLLQEYCYDEYGTLARFVGSELVDAAGRSLQHEVLDDPEQLVAALTREFGTDGNTEE